MPCFFKKIGWQSLLHGKMNLKIIMSKGKKGVGLFSEERKPSLPIPQCTEHCNVNSNVHYTV